MDDPRGFGTIAPAVPGHAALGCHPFHLCCVRIADKVWGRSNLIFRRVCLPASTCKLCSSTLWATVSILHRAVPSPMLATIPGRTSAVIHGSLVYSPGRRRFSVTLADVADGDPASEGGGRGVFVCREVFP